MNKFILKKNVRKILHDSVHSVCSFFNDSFDARIKAIIRTYETIISIDRFRDVSARHSGASSDVTIRTGHDPTTDCAVYFFSAAFVSA
jgi:hypothetical protein